MGELLHFAQIRPVTSERSPEVGIFDKFKGQAQDKGKEIIDNVGDEVDEKTGGKFKDQVDKGQDAAKDALGIDKEGEQPK
ncbi:antitoxin [Streptomyces sp. NBC_01304]|nr:antitoxin [Streptomyces sp. NBC_01304]